jgi:peptidoglycan/LPS O-acetylase OafA/YrhL
MAGASFHRLVSFGSASRVASIVCFVLASVWVLAPEVLLSMWHVESNDATVLLSRRSAALFTGIGTMLWLARDASDSSARKALAAGFAVTCTMLAISGCYEFAVGHAGPGILLAVTVEALLAAVFNSARRSEQ